LIRIVDADTTEQHRIFPDNYGEVTDIAFSPDGRYLAAVAETTQLVVWEVESSTVVEEINTEQEEAFTVTFTPDGTLLLGVDEGFIYGWDFTPYLATE
ncbi:MAG: hypothetical protein AAF125_08175, partial [Chloroflexota bacterium]